MHIQFRRVQKNHGFKCKGLVYFNHLRRFTPVRPTVGKYTVFSDGGTDTALAQSNGM
jgi:hypothetical protein